MQFLEKFVPETLEYMKLENGKYFLDKKKWDNLYQSLMDPARDWLKLHQEEALKEYNKALFK